MGVSTSIVADHSVITPPVEYANIRDVLGTRSSPIYLYELCQAGTINRWARYKPVIRNLVDTTNQQNSNGTWKSSATWWKATAQNCGITVSVYSDLVTMIKAWYQKTNQSWQDFWKYTPPAGTEDVSPFRTSDFNYYCHVSTLTGGEDNDKPVTGFMVGGYSHEIHRYQVDGQYVTDGQAQLYIRPDNPYLLSITDISIPDGADLSSFKDAYFGVAAIRTTQTASDSSYYMSAITTPYTFSQNAPASDWHPAGYDLRFTPLFPETFLRNLVNYDFLFFPFLSTKAIAATDTAAQWSAKSSITNGAKYIPLPFYPLTVRYLPQTPIVKITARFVSVTSSGSGLSAQVRFKADNLMSSGSPAWTNNKVNIKFQVFKDGQSPPTINESNYVPASTSFTGSTWPKTYTTTYSLAGAASGKNEIIVTLESSEGTILVGSGDHYSNL